jgi:predicted transcriptional regulator
MKEADWLVVRRSLDMNWAEIARQLEIDERTLRRYRKGELPVPYKVQLALEGLICRKLHGNRPARIEKPSEMRATALLRRIRHG